MWSSKVREWSTRGRSEHAERRLGVAAGNEPSRLRSHLHRNFGQPESSAKTSSGFRGVDKERRPAPGAMRCNKKGAALGCLGLEHKKGSCQKAAV